MDTAGREASAGGSGRRKLGGAHQQQPQVALGESGHLVTHFMTQKVNSGFLLLLAGLLVPFPV